MDGTPAYTPVARTLHWLTAMLVIGLITVGIWMHMLESGPLQDRLYNLHRSTGVLLLPLVIIRLLYRWTHPPLPLPEDVPAFQRLVAEATHWGLYALLIVQPLVGWAATSSYRAPIIVYGLFELPPILAVNQPLSEKLFVLHRWLGFLMAAMVSAHAGAALFHHFIRRDRVLMRMVRGG
jgi:cytochrome b561